MIMDNSNLLTEPKEVANCMNIFFSSVASHIGADRNSPAHSDYASSSDFTDAAINFYSEHQSIINIKNNATATTFSFTRITEKEAETVIKNLDIKKATGFDRLPAKILAPSSGILAPNFARLYNMCVKTGTFPSVAKLAEVVPIYKKDNAQNKKNHRPVSLLTSSSKVLERLMLTQMSNSWLSDNYHAYLSAFRPNYGCQHVLLGICEMWRMAKEAKEIPALLLVDLSKAFDCLSHPLTVAKLNAYGMDRNSVTLIADYLTNRHQRVKIDQCVSDWNILLKGVPQGSLLGPTIFNLFINDIFYDLKYGKLFNYADDNSVFLTAKTLDSLKESLQSSADEILDWCSTNLMEANPEKFQCIIADNDQVEINFGENTSVYTQTPVKLLGVLLDNKLNFNDHVSFIVKKATRQLNCMKRIAYALPTDIKLLLYKSFVMSNLNYCPAVWHHCGARNTDKIEKIQFRALRFVFSDYDTPYEALLLRANMPSLEVRRLRVIALEVFKATNDFSPSYMKGLFTQQTTKYNLRSGNSIRPKTNRTTNYGLHSFTHFGGTLWNSIPSEVRKNADIKTFKMFLQTWNGPRCMCSFCRSTQSRY